MADAVTRTRAGFRATFTRLADAVEEELANDVPNLEVLTSKMHSIEDKSARLKELDDDVLNNLAETNADEAVVNTEHDRILEYEERLFSLQRRVDAIINPPVITPENTRRSSISSSSASFRSAVNVTAAYKFPKVTIRPFDGSLSDWLPWWSQFKGIHESRDASAAEKYQFLAQSVVPGSRAAEVLAGYTQSAENYDKAVDALKSRFGREDLLAEYYVRDLLKLSMSSVLGKDKLALPKLYDQLTSKLQSLDSLGRSSVKHGEFLYPLVESSLSEDIIRAWQRSALYAEDQGPTPRTQLERLMAFLKTEVQNEERLLLTKSGFGQESVSKSKKKPEASEHVATAAGLFGASEKSCSCCFCGSSKHESRDCFKAQKMTWPEKKDCLKKADIDCYCLVPGHGPKACKTPVKCVICSKRHQPLMCPELSKLPKPQQKSETPSGNVVNCLGQGCTRSVPLQSLKVRLCGPKGQKVVRAMFDTGCQRSCVLKATAAELGFKSNSSVLLNHILYGGSSSGTVRHSIFKVKVRSLDEKWTVNFDVIDEKLICQSTPSMVFPSQIELLKKKDVEITDPDQEGPVELCIGNDVYGKILTGQVLQVTGSGLTAIETLLGWVLAGKAEAEERGTAMTVTSMLSKEVPISQLWELDVLGIKDPIEVKSKAALEEDTKQHFLSTVSIDAEGRYQVNLPWVQGSLVRPPNNICVAERRLEAAVKKLKETGHLQSYGQVFQEWLDEGIIEEVPEEQLKSSAAHYLPHRPVIKESSSTTKIRPVFDASCKKAGGYSLNSCVAKGPNLLELIPAIVTRLRLRAVGAVADIRKAFLQISVAPEDRDYLRFLWVNNDGSLRVFRHKRVVFGVNSSPFLLGAVIEKHLKQVRGDLEVVAEKLLKNLYVDNYVGSHDSHEEALEFQSEAINLMEQGKMDLRMWEFGGKAVNFADGTSEVTGVLGMSWDRRADLLFVVLKTLEAPVEVTKRSILSAAHSLFDPMGLLCAVALEPKLLLRQICCLKLGWDDEVPEEISCRFEKWLAELRYLKSIKIPRRMAEVPPEVGAWSLHVFVDASGEAFAAVAFIRVEFEGQVTVRFLQAKARVGPAKQATIPRLELLACLIGARLSKSVLESAEQNWPVILWSDSSTALTWIKKNECWGPFVGNRVDEIRKLTEVQNWRHVPGTMNPADLPSRGSTAKKLAESTWWEGPEWLYRPQNTWPVEKVAVDEGLVNLELKKSTTSMLATGEDDFWYLRRFSSYNQVIRLVAVVLRWKNRKFRGEPISGEEFVAAEIIIWRMIQSLAGIKEVYNNIPLSQNESGLWCVRTKLTLREDLQSFIEPALLPFKHPLMDLLVRQIHLDHGHAGTQTVMALLRERVYCPKARRLVKKIISRCGRCQRFVGRSFKTPEADLPAARVQDSRVFEVVGVDLFGPFYLKDGSEVYGVIFSCAVYRAIHLELVDSMSTEAFLMALRRFIARRGRPTMMFTDQGRNFIGTENLFAGLDWEKIVAEHRLQRITWRFNPPAAPWWGGFYERLIGLVKTLLLRVLGRSVLERTELETVICEAESTVNSRPLTHINDDPTDLKVLSPKMFLTELPSGVQDVDAAEGDMMKGRYSFRVKLLEDLKKRFRREYLSLLVQKKKKVHGEIKVGDVVLIGQDGKKRLTWPLARVLKLYPGVDGVVRVALLKSENGEFVRPVQRLYLMETETLEM